MGPRPIKRPVFFHEHFLNEMSAAAQENVSYFAMMLDNAAKLSFDEIVLIFQDLLKFVENDNNIFVVLIRDPSRRFKHSSSARSILTFLLNPKLSSGFPSSLRVIVGTRLLKRLFPVLGSFSTEVLIEDVMAFAKAVTKPGSSSVGQRSTYADTVRFGGSLAITL